MLHRELHGLNPHRLIGQLVGVEHLQRHDLRIGCHPGSGSRYSGATYGSCHMGAMSTLVSRVVVVRIKVIAMVRILRTAVPKSSLQVGMGQAHARIDDGNEHLLTGIALLPHLVGVHHQQVFGNLATVASGGRYRCVVKEPLALLAMIQCQDVVSLPQAFNGNAVGPATDGIDNPQRPDVFHQPVAFHLFKQVQQVGLRGFCLPLQAFNHILTPCLFGAEVFRFPQKGNRIRLFR